MAKIVTSDVPTQVLVLRTCVLEQKLVTKLTTKKLHKKKYIKYNYTLNFYVVVVNNG